ncbi:acyloxyacyl hydrolase [Granulicella sp. dw_53]|uniref:acyloxyacyl hydrolase n=1 Tax=Granulicella sp. dw_53 TaxID=2719792 RepID=UPI001BD6661C|nr:acyloxyacyl hydrolase [Granulicella sp. dw_53]
MRMTTRKRLLRGVAISLSFFITVRFSLTQSTAQVQKPLPTSPAPVVEVGLIYVAERTKLTYGDNFWLQGGSGELSFPIYKSISLAMNVTGAHKGNISSANSGFSKVSFVAGPRYTFDLHKSRLFVEALFGGVHGFDGVFPAVNGARMSANAFAMQTGGGYEIDLKKRVSLRLIDASYVRTHLPNGGSNSQGDLRLAAGIIFRFPTH